MAVKFECKICGDKKISNFYSSVRNLCKKHHNERCKERKRSHPGNIPLTGQDLPEAIKDMEPHPAPPELAEKIMAVVAESPPPTPKYVCSIHGPHSGHRVGSHFSSTCPKCVNARRSVGIKSSGVFLRLEAYPWLRRWLSKQAGCEETDNIQVATKAMRLLAEMVPAEDIKAYLLEERDAC